MQVGVTLLPSRIDSEEDPGHMTFCWEKTDAPAFRGFAFRVEDLPPEFQKASKYRNYLFTHQVPGYIEGEERDPIACRYTALRKILIRKSWEVDDGLLPRINIETRPRQYGLYSFNPDDFPSCFNCVTWATSVLNSIAGDVIRPVRQGRIKLMKAQLEEIT